MVQVKTLKSFDSNLSGFFCLMVNLSPWTTIEKVAGNNYFTCQVPSFAAWEHTSGEWWGWIQIANRSSTASLQPGKPLPKHLSWLTQPIRGNQIVLKNCDSYNLNTRYPKSRFIQKLAFLVAGIQISMVRQTRSEYWAIGQRYF